MLIENKRRVTPCCGFTDLRKELNQTTILWIWHLLHLCSSLFIFVSFRSLFCPRFLRRGAHRSWSAKTTHRGCLGRSTWIGSERFHAGRAESCWLDCTATLSWFLGTNCVVSIYDDLIWFDVFWWNRTCEVHVKMDVEHWDLTILHIIEIDQANLEQVCMIVELQEDWESCFCVTFWDMMLVLGVNSKHILSETKCMQHSCTLCSASKWVAKTTFQFAKMLRTCHWTLFSKSDFQLCKHHQWDRRGFLNWKRGQA